MSEPMDFTPPPESRHEEKVSAPDHLQPSSKFNMEYLMESDKIRLAQAKPVDKVVDVGQIGTMKLPSGFVEGESERGTVGSNMFQEYHLAADPSVKLYLEYRGFKMSKATGGKFHDILAEPPHKLSAEELKSLGEMFDTRSNPSEFHTQIAKTQDVDGKRVLVLEGRYLKHDLQARTMFIDADDTGRVVQQVTFQTPMDKRSQYFNDGINALESIKWR